MKKIKRNFNYEYLPLALIKGLKVLFSSYREYRTHNNILLIVSTICMKQITDDTFSYSYVPLSVEYWRKVIGSHYSTYLSTLIKNNIVQTEWVLYESESGDISRVKGYRINPSILNDEFSLIKYLGSKAENESSDVITSIVEENKPLVHLGFNPELITMQKLKALDFVKTGLSDIINSYKNTGYASGVPQTLPVLVRIFNKDDSFNSIHLSVEAA